jgi:dTDP-4-dehydrorhamnose 3,5-epimerase
MGNLTVTQTGLPGCLLLEPRVFSDARGHFFESWSERAFAEIGITTRWVQDNASRSTKGVLRGLHFQNPTAQVKLVRATQGAVWDVVVDVRNGSPTYRKWYGVELSAANHRMLYVPVGFAHGFLTLSESADFVYKCGDVYNPAADAGVRWDDPAIGVDWPLAQIGGEPLLSDKDRALPLLRDVPPDKRFTFAG